MILMFLANPGARKIFPTLFHFTFPRLIFPVASRFRLTYEHVVSFLSFFQRGTIRGYNNISAVCFMLLTEKKRPL